MASTYHVFGRGAPVKSFQMKLGPAEPRTSGPKGWNVASTVIGTVEVTLDAQMFTAAWNAVARPAVNPW